MLAAGIVTDSQHMQIILPQTEVKVHQSLQPERQPSEAHNLCQMLQLPMQQTSQFQDVEELILHPSLFQSLSGILRVFVPMVEPETSILSELDSSDTCVNANTLAGAHSGRHDSDAKLQSPCIFNFSIDASQPFQVPAQELYGLAHQSYLKNICSPSGTFSCKKMDLDGPQDTLNLPNISKCYSSKNVTEESNIYGNDHLEVSSGSTLIDPYVSGLVMERFSTLKGDCLYNPSEGLLGDYSSSQDLQSQVTSMGPSDSQTFSAQEVPETFGRLPSCSAAARETGFHTSSLQQGSPPFRTYTKVQKLGSVGRSIDVMRFKDYDELKYAIACMFGLEGKLNDPRESDWKLVYTDYQNDVLLVGDDPWEEFIRDAFVLSRFFLLPRCNR